MIAHAWSRVSAAHRVMTHEIRHHCFTVCSNTHINSSPLIVCFQNTFQEVKAVSVYFCVICADYACYSRSGSAESLMPPLWKCFVYLYFIQSNNECCLLMFHSEFPQWITLIATVSLSLVKLYSFPWSTSPMHFSVILISHLGMLSIS